MVLFILQNMFLILHVLAVGEIGSVTARMEEIVLKQKVVARSRKTQNLTFLVLRGCDVCNSASLYLNRILLIKLMFSIVA